MDRCCVCFDLVGKIFNVGFCLVFMKCIVGIESTAHTFGVGIVDMSGKILANVKDSYTTSEGGMIPLEVRRHHKKVSDKVWNLALREAGVGEGDVECVAFSNAPGLAPCLLEGMDFAKGLAKRLGIELIGVNHCVAHLVIGESFGARDPVMLYASGANTQVIAFEGGKFRVFGETLDLGVGNFIDTIARSMGLGFPGGAKIERLAKKFEEKNGTRANAGERGQKRRVIFMHGKDKDSSSAWYPWFGKEVERRGLEFVAPCLPKTHNPVLTEWLSELDKINPREDDILVGHSRGGMAIMRWLERCSKGRRVGKVVLLAANNPDIKEKNQKKNTFGFYESGSYDFKKIKSHCDNFVVFHSRDDPWVYFESGELNTEGTGGRFRIFEERFHFGANFKNVPELLEEIESRIITNHHESAELLELPYVVKGMDVSFSGIQTKIRNLISKGEDNGKLAFALQENVFAMLVEVAERALAHTGKGELLIGGGVGCNARLVEMCRVMCEERGVKFFVPSRDLLVDNGAMIGYLGLKMFRAGLGTKDYDKIDIKPRERTDEVICDSWR